MLLLIPELYSFTANKLRFVFELVSCLSLQPACDEIFTESRYAEQILYMTLNLSGSSQAKEVRNSVLQLQMECSFPKSFHISIFFSFNIKLIDRQRSPASTDPSVQIFFFVFLSLY